MQVPHNSSSAAWFDRGMALPGRSATDASTVRGLLIALPIAALLWAPIVWGVLQLF